MSSIEEHAADLAHTGQIWRNSDLNSAGSSLEQTNLRRLKKDGFLVSQFHLCHQKSVPRLISCLNSEKAELSIIQTQGQLDHPQGARNTRPPAPSQTLNVVPRSTVSIGRMGSKAILSYPLPKILEDEDVEPNEPFQKVNKRKLLIKNYTLQWSIDSTTQMLNQSVSQA